MGCDLCRMCMVGGQLNLSGHIILLLMRGLRWGGGGGRG